MLTLTLMLVVEIVGVAWTAPVLGSACVDGIMQLLKTSCDERGERFAVALGVGRVGTVAVAVAVTVCMSVCDCSGVGGGDGEGWLAEGSYAKFITTVMSKSAREE